MVSMHVSDRRRFPALAAWARDALPLLPRKQRVWRQFLIYGEFTHIAGLGVVRWGHNSPLLYVTALSKANGMFSNATPNKIYIDSFLAKAIQANPRDAEVIQFVESTVLHELVHLGDYRDGEHRKDVDEAGKAFERAAYGRDIDRKKDMIIPGRNRNAILNANPGPDSYGQFMTDDYGAPPDNGEWPRGIRNNNPGNIKIGDDWVGLASDGDMSTRQQSERVFCVFETPVYGVRAMVKTLITYQRRGIRTLAGIIERWAPPNDNNKTEAYIEFVVQHSGIERNQVLDVMDEHVAQKLVRAIITMENGFQPYRTDVLEQGLELAGVQA